MFLRAEAGGCVYGCAGGRGRGGSEAEGGPGGREREDCGGTGHTGGVVAQAVNVTVVDKGRLAEVGLSGRGTGSLVVWGAVVFTTYNSTLALLDFIIQIFIRKLCNGLFLYKPSYLFICLYCEAAGTRKALRW